MKNEDIIRLSEWPTDYAQRAYKSRNYIEAIQVIHGFIETKLQELLILEGSKSKPMKEIYDVANQISLSYCVKVLYIIDIISKKEYDDIRSFNKMRNNIIHGLFAESYDEGVKGFSKREYDAAFKNGIILCNLLQLKTDLYNM